MKALLTAILASTLAITALPAAANAFSLSSIIGGASPSAPAGSQSRGDAVRGPVLMAQANDATVQVGQLAEQVRKLTGQVQDLNYQLLQMQEQMRQMQKDNEFRFERLEGNGGGTATGAPQPGSDHSRNTTAPSTDQAQAGSPLPGVASGTTASTRRGNSTGAPPAQLGTLTLDEGGNMLGASVDAPGGNASGNDVASLPSSSSPEDIYRTAYNQVLAGNYKAAAGGFRDYLDVYPDGPQAADASFWLGESQFSQGEFNKAARTFLDAHKKYPNAQKAPETLLKLGMALAALNNQNTACATYDEVLKRYPNASDSVRKKVAFEKKRGGC